MSAPAEVILRSEALEASFLPEIGARIHRLRAFGHDVLRTPEDPATHRDDPFFWGAYVMAPWCNRGPAGRAAVAGRAVELAANFPDGSAIHGLVGARPWAWREGDGFEVRHEAPADGWPWSFKVRLLAAIEGDTLHLDYRLTNVADAPMPAGLGLHPWLRGPLELAVPARAVYGSNVASPAEPSPVRGRHDLRSPNPSPPGLDATWTGFAEPAIELAWPAFGVRASLEMASSDGTLVAVASPAGIPAVAVEPQTHGPDPFRRLAAGQADAPTLLAPGASLHLGLRLRFALARNVLASGGYG